MEYDDDESISRKNISISEENKNSKLNSNDEIVVKTEIEELSSSEYDTSGLGWGDPGESGCSNEWLEDENDHQKINNEEEECITNSEEYLITKRAINKFDTTTPNAEMSKISEKEQNIT